MPTVITGTDGINQVQAGAVESGDLASGAIGSGDLPAGSVIQVKHAINDTQVFSTSPGEVSLGLTISITPTSTDSKFLIIGNIGAHPDAGGGFGVRIKRDSTLLRTAELELFISDGINSFRNKVTASIIDSPNTTNSLVYEVLANQFNNTTVEYHENAGTRQTSDMIVMEIAG